MSENIETNDAVVWVQKTVGNTLNTITGYLENGLDEKTSQTIRKTLYMEATHFLLADNAMAIDIKKECVLQVLGRFEGLMKYQSKCCEVQAISSRAQYWKGLEDVKKFSSKMKIDKEVATLFEAERQKVEASIEYAHNCFKTESKVKNKI